jgi:hypothetical protein
LIFQILRAGVVEPVRRIRAGFVLERQI